MRNRPFLDRKNALARLLRNIEAGIPFNEDIAEDGPVAFAQVCRLGAEGIVSKKVFGTYQSGRCRLGVEGIVSKKVDSTYRSGLCRVWIKVRNPVSVALQRERRQIWNR
jgi:bifunctional non-homologous end joining protein LigD